MRLYLAPTSSLELIRYLRSMNGAYGLEGTVSRKRLMDDCIHAMHDIDGLDVTAQFWLGNVSRPIHAFVSDRAWVNNSKQLVTHLYSQRIPSGSFLDLGHGVCICTPPNAFLRLGTEYDLVNLIKLGMELCGTYSKWAQSAPGGPTPDRPGQAEERSCAYGVPPVTQARLIRQFLDRAEGQHGAQRARQAARYVLDGAASPMEANVYLLLCLPKRLGGYGLPQPQLNPKLIIANPSGNATIERHPDLFWLGPNIDVEYNSDAEHSGEWSRYRDSKREVELTVADVRVLPLTRAQLMDSNGFDEFAQGLRHMLGIRTRPEDPRWRQRRAELRRALLLESD